MEEGQASEMAWPLEGVRVIDMTQNVAGPYCGMILAEMGASVLKIEPPGGDPTRSWGPPFWEGYGPVFLALNRNKDGIVIDIKSEAGLAALHEELRGADVVLVSTRPGVLEKYGLDYAALHERYPSLVYGEVTAYGNYGPNKNDPGYDPLMQALGGIMSVTGRTGEEPVRVGTSIIDMGTGMWLAIGVIGAIQMRSRTGHGSHVLSSLFETAVGWMAYHANSFWASGESPHGWGSGTSVIVPYEAFPTSDGGDWIVIGAGNDSLFLKLCVVLGHPEWGEDPLFRSNPLRVVNRSELVSRIRATTSFWKSDELSAVLVEAGIPTAPVANVAQVLSNPQLLAGGLIQSIDHPDISGFKSIGLPLVIDDQRPLLRTPPPGDNGAIP